MRMSDDGIEQLIKPHEGYLTKQADGSCRAYKCPAGVWTCGWGCTEGVGPNTHWTRDEASEALAKEVRKHEAAIERLVKVPLNQRQFDALVSLCYNIGEGAVARSALLKHLNAGDYARAASHFADFKYAKVQGATATRMKVKPGTSVVLPGLVERRAHETSMFLEAAPVLDAMPQKVEPPRTKLDVADIGLKVVPTAGGVGIACKEVVSALQSGVPEVPQVATKSLENFSAWKTFGKSFFEIGREGYGVVMIAGRLWPLVLVAGVAGGVLAVLSYRKKGANEQHS